MEFDGHFEQLDDIQGTILRSRIIGESEKGEIPQELVNKIPHA